MKRALSKSSEADIRRKRKGSDGTAAGPNPLLNLQRTAGNRAVVQLLQTRGQLQTKLRTGEPGNQQEQEADAAANTATKLSTAKAGALIVEDDAGSVAPGQMRKSEFLEQLRSHVCTTADEALVEAGQSTEGCPYIEQWFGYYADKPPAHIEQALRRYAPEAASATSARDYIPAVSDRVRRSIATWARTGELTGVPEELQGMLSGPGAALGAIAGMIGGALSSIGSAIGGAFSSIGKALFKRKEGQAETAEDPQAVQTQLSAGQPLDGGVKSRLGAAFGYDFSGVRVHTDAQAAGLSDDLNARAFTIGNDIAFGAGEYQPGTMIGDALIAHELAHVVQQEGGNNTAAAPQSKNDHASAGLEEDADVAAAGAVSSLWLGAQGALTDIGRNALPRMKAGLRLQSCTKHHITNQGTIVKTRESGHDTRVRGPGGEIQIVHAPDMTEAEADAELSKLGLLSKVTKVKPPTNSYDCHGYTFLDGASWIDNDQVPAILAENGYLPTTAPVVGDILVYEFNGELKHSGIITEVTGGTVTKITSKWGLWGLYSHDPKDVPPTYGKFTAYHTDRPGGHKLRREK